MLEGVSTSKWIFFSFFFWIFLKDISMKIIENIVGELIWRVELPIWNFNYSHIWIETRPNLFFIQSYVIKALRYLSWQMEYIYKTLFSSCEFCNNIFFRSSWTSFTWIYLQTDQLNILRRLPCNLIPNQFSSSNIWTMSHQNIRWWSENLY